MPYPFLLICAAAIFCMGVLGLIIRQNLLVMLMCIELMLNAVNLTFVLFAHRHADMAGQCAVFFTITVAAAESAVGLGLVIALFRTLKTVESHAIETMKG